MFASKQKQLEKQLALYREKAALCVNRFRDVLREYCETGDIKQLREHVKEVHAAESEADDIRRAVADMMFARSLFPESRGDILNLLETMDKVPNQAESVLRGIGNQLTVIPEFMHEKVFMLADASCEAADAMLEASAQLFKNLSSATAMTGKIDAKESEADRLEAELVRMIFADDTIPDLQKILLRDMVKQIAAISDRAENAGDRIRVIVVKRLM